MAEIDNLNFKVILDDQEFDARVKRDIKLAQDLNIKLSKLLQVKQHVNSVPQSEVQNARRLGQMETDRLRALEVQNRERIKTEGLQRRINAQVERTTRSYQTQSRILGELKGYALGYLSIHGASQLLDSLIRITGEFEVQKSTLGAMLGDLDQAENIISRIQGLAVESPFQFRELTTYAKQLSAFSVPAQELYDTTKMIADISAGLGVDMNRIILAYGQVRSAAFLRGQEVRQFTEAGIPILDELAKQFTELEGRAVSTGEVFDKISARLVPFEMVAKVLRGLTEEGGRFYNMQEIQAETLKGKWTNLKDAYEVMINEIGSAHSDKLKGAIDGVRSLMQNWERIGGQLVDLIKLFGAYKVAVGLLSISDTIAKFGGLAKAIQGTAAAQRLMNSALMTNPYIVVATAITAVAIAISRHRKSLSDTTAAQTAYNKRVKELERIDRDRSNAIRSLVDVVQDETQATIEREAALMSLKEAYPDIFAQYDIESLKLADILSIKRQIAEEDAKQRKIEAYGAIGAQEGRLKALIARGAADSYTDSAVAVLREMQKDYLKKYVLPDMIAGLRDMTDEALASALQDVYRKSQYDIVGLERFDDIPTTQDFYEDFYSAIQAEITRRKGIKPVEGWRKKIQDALTGLGLDEGTSFGLWAKDTTQSTEYVEELIKRYRELGDEIKLVSSFDKDQVERLNRNKQAIEAVAKALNIDIAALASNKSKEKSPLQIETERQIEQVKRLRDAYESLAPYMNGEMLQKTLTALFPDADQKLIQSLNFRAKLVELAAQLNEFDENASQRLLDSIGGERVSDIVSAFKAVETYKNMLDSWLGEDTTLTGEGIAFDIDKILREMNNQYAKINQKALQANDLLTKAQMGDAEALKKVREVYGEEVWEKYLTNGKQVIEELANTEKATARKTAQEKINDLANVYVKGQTESLNLSDWGDKSIGQVMKIKSAFDGIRNSELQLDENLLAEITAAGLTLDEFVAKVQEAFERIGEEVDDEVIKKVIGLGKVAAQQVLNISSALEDLSSKTNNTVMSNAANAIREFGDVFSATLDGFKNGGVAGAIIAGVGTIATKLIEASSAAENLRHELALAAIEYENALERIKYENIQESFDNLFGSDGYAKFRKNVSEVRDSLKEISAIGAETIKWKDAPYVTTLVSDLRTGWQKFWDMDKNQFSFNRVDLFDAAGQPIEEKFEELRAFYETYGEGLSNSEKELVTELLTEWQRYEDAMTASAEYVSSLFGDVASSMADSLVESFKESGKAALEYGDIMDSVATNIAKSIIEGILLQNVFTEEVQKSAIEALASGNATGAAAIVDAAMDAAKDLAPYLQNFLESMEPYFEMGEGSTKNLGEGIKGITEDQANLLASYLNAIRADVSYSKTLWERMDVSLQRIADMFVSSPTLMEYQAQIAANTFNTAQATQAILSELRGVVTTDSGPSSIRVYREN